MESYKIWLTALGSARVGRMQEECTGSFNLFEVVSRLVSLNPAQAHISALRSRWMGIFENYSASHPCNYLYNSWGKRSRSKTVLFAFEMYSLN